MNIFSIYIYESKVNIQGGLLEAVLNLPGLNLTSRFTKPEVKYLVHLLCTKQVHHWFSKP